VFDAGHDASLASSAAIDSRGRPLSWRRQVRASGALRIARFPCWHRESRNVPREWQRARSALRDQHRAKCAREGHRIGHVPASMLGRHAWSQSNTELATVAGPDKSDVRDGYPSQVFDALVNSTSANRNVPFSRTHCATISIPVLSKVKISARSMPDPPSNSFTKSASCSKASSAEFA
jgi:hypothetical protein